MKPDIVLQRYKRVVSCAWDIASPAKTQAYEEKILAQLEKVKDNTIEVGDGKLSRNITKSKGALKKEIIYKALNKLTKNDIKAKEMTTFILDSRPDIQKIKLKRSKNKKK